VTTSERRRFAWGHALAWAPYAALYAAVFVAQGRTTVLRAVRDALRNVVPAAGLGELLLRVVHRAPWPARVPGRRAAPWVARFAAALALA
jgi:hypothetical protein